MSEKAPLDWKTAIIRPVFEKGDKFDASNYRPVTLISLVVKLIPREQHGFLPGRSVQSNLLCYMSDWTKDADSERPLDNVYFDFSKMFDRVPKGRLLHKLDHLRLRGNLHPWIDSLLSDRTFRVKTGDALSRSIDVLSEVPQGSVLDDIKLYNVCDNFSSLSPDRRSFYKWFQVWLLLINLDKCVTLHLGKGNPRHVCSIERYRLATTECHMDLGVHVCSSLLWSDHILQLYKTYVRPIPEFANEVLSLVLQRDIFLLEAVQRSTTRIPFDKNRRSYPDRLKQINLCSIAERRKKGDLIYQALSNDLSPIKCLFPPNTSDCTRGHPLKLLKDKFRTTREVGFKTEYDKDCSKT
ncbi:uncharacterized protein LOC135131661 [Zophobas morio]|uniref:uncharacterized protein LOC135131661 n=1 Tax=Zophobas morio TaxID=2755281 RepID=UPI003083570C